MQPSIHSDAIQLKISLNTSYNTFEKKKKSGTEKEKKAHNSMTHGLTCEQPPY